MPTQPAETTRHAERHTPDAMAAPDSPAVQERLRDQARATRATHRMVTLLAERPELRGVHAPADLFDDAVRWCA